MSKIHDDAEPEPLELILAKQKYGAGMWEPRVIGQRNSRGRLISISFDYENKKFWPWKKWIFINGEWMPSPEMDELFE